MAALAVLPAEAAETAAARADVRVRVWPHQGYGRIVFDWPAAVSHEATLADRILSLRFGSAFAARLDDIAGRLSQYVEAVRMGGDGRSAEVTLKAGVRFKTFASGTSVVVDLLPGSKTAKSPAKVDGKTTVPVRIGAHATFNRFVFDWSRAVNYDVAQQGDEAVIRFDHAATFDLAAVRRDLPPFVRAVTERPGENAIALRLVEGAQVRHFRTGTSVVLDILRPASKTPQAAKEHQSAKAPKKEKASRPATAKESARNAGAVNRPAKTQAAVAAPKGTASAPKGSHADVARPAARPAPVKARTTPEKAPTSLLPTAAGAVAPAASAIPVILNLDPAAAVVRFHWPDEVGAAVFTRAGYLWAVFDREARLAFEGWDEALAKPSPNSKRRPEEKPAAAFIARPEFSSSGGVSTFRMRVPEGVNPRVARDKATWVVTLEREYLKPATGIPVESHVGAAAGARLYIAVPDAAQAVAVPDPEVGDRLWVVPLSAAGKGVGLARTYAEVELFATAQGIAGRGLSDGVAFHTLPKGIEIGTHTGLTLSGANVEGGGTNAQADAGASRPGWLFDLRNWRRAATGNFVENKHALQLAAAVAPPTTRNAARLQLAQLLFAYDNFSDVLGIFEVIEQDEPERAREPVFRAMRGAANYWLGDYERAALDLGNPVLDSFKEVALWRAGLAAVRKDWATASRFFARSEAILKAYPSAYRVHFGLLAAEAALNIGDVGLTKFHLDSLDALAPARGEKATIDYMRGQLLAKVLDPEGAVAAWTRAIAGPDRRVRVLATLARTDLLLAKGKINKQQAIEQLEKLRFSWRGDDLEVMVLKRLGEAYIAAEDYRNGLMTLRELATHFPKYPGTDKIIDAMRAAFVKLYVDGAADKLPPLTSLALYDQFRELTPEGDVGNELIARLAERLVAVDLLDRAATLLRHLVDQRLKGSDRFDARNRLALVYLLDRKPQEALDVLAGQLPDDILPQTATARRHLKGRALAELARYQETLALIADDMSVEAEQLRADVQWKLRDWTNAAISYARILDATVKDMPAGKDGPGKEAALDDAAQNHVMSLAIAHALSRNQAALGVLRQRFLGRMSKTPYKESFDVVTAPSGNVPDDYRVIASKVAEVDQYRAFLQGYRERLLARGTRPGPARPAQPSVPSVPAQPSAAAPSAATQGRV